MKPIMTILVILVAAIFFVSCKPAEKAMTAEEFLKIENEVLATDLKPESKEAVVKKFGYTLKAYTDFEEKIEKDAELKKKVGEIRLNMEKKEDKKDDKKDVKKKK